MNSPFSNIYQRIANTVKVLDAAMHAFYVLAMLWAAYLILVVNFCSY